MACFIEHAACHLCVHLQTQFSRRKAARPRTVNSSAYASSPVNSPRGGSSGGVTDKGRQGQTHGVRGDEGGLGGGGRRGWEHQGGDARDDSEDESEHDTDDAELYADAADGGAGRCCSEAVIGGWREDSRASEHVCFCAMMKRCMTRARAREEGDQ